MRLHTMHKRRNRKLMRRQKPERMEYTNYSAKLISLDFQPFYKDLPERPRGEMRYKREDFSIEFSTKLSVKDVSQMMSFFFPCQDLIETQNGEVEHRVYSDILDAGKLDDVLGSEEIE